MVRVLSSSLVDHRLEPRSGQTEKAFNLVFVASPIQLNHWEHLVQYLAYLLAAILYFNSASSLK
jgi:hypothetical protein